MNRREFMYVTTGAVAISVLTTCDAICQVSPSGSARYQDEISVAEFHAGRKFVKTGQGRIAYTEKGHGPAAIFLHGFPLNSFQWRGVIPQLAHKRRCIAPDFLALGYTEVRDGQSVAPRDQLKTLVELMDRLSISAVDIVANDSGGAIAQLFAAHHPEHVRSLLFTNCDTEPDSPPAAVLPVIELARAGKFADEWLVPWLADKTLARSEKGLGGQCYADPAHPSDEVIETYLGPLVSSPRRKALTNAYAVGLAPNPLIGVEAKLKRCQAPIRIVWGEADKIFSNSSSGYLAHTFPNSQGVRRLPGAKLFFPEEMPDVIVEETKRLWGV